MSDGVGVVRLLMFEVGVWYGRGCCNVVDG